MYGNVPWVRIPSSLPEKKSLAVLNFHATMKKMGGNMKYTILSILALFTVISAPNLAIACDGENCAAGLVYEAYGVPASGKATTLAVFVHGDVTSGGAADYMNSYAKSFAASKKGVVAVALIRNGYGNSKGQNSDGFYNRREMNYGGQASGVADAIRALKAKFGAQRVVGLGHSGGAAILGIIAGQDSNLLNGVVLAACPCDMQTFAQIRGGNSGGNPSPIQYINGVSPSTSIVAVHGQGDDKVPPIISDDYIAKAQSLGLKASLRKVAGGHNFGGGMSGAATAALGAMAR